MSKWWPLRPLNFVQYLFEDGDLKNELLQSFNSSAVHKLKKLASGYPDNGEAFEKWIKTIGKLFILPTHEFSSQLAHSILYEKRQALGATMQVHGILFPSMVKEHRSMNYALPPDVVDTCFRPSVVHQYAFRDNSIDGANITVKGVGLVGNSGEVIWYDVRNSSSGVHIVKVAFKPENGDAFEVKNEEMVEFEGKSLSAKEFAEEQFRSVFPDLVKHLGEVPDIEPGTVLRKPYTASFQSSVPITTTRGVVQLKEVIVEVLIRPEFILRD